MLESDKPDSGLAVGSLSRGRDCNADDVKLLVAQTTGGGFSIVSERERERERERVDERGTCQMASPESFSVCSFCLVVVNNNQCGGCCELGVSCNDVMSPTTRATLSDQSPQWHR